MTHPTFRVWWGLERLLVMFLEFWELQYPGCVPLAWKVREGFGESWFRIHSLPDSKRYPENEVEEDELLRRHTLAAFKVLGAHEAMWLCWCGCGELFGVAGEKVMELADGTTIYAVKIKWRQDLFNDLVLDIAYDQIDRVMFMTIDSGNIYAPYDGGADLFVKDSAKYQDCKEGFGKWLSPHDEGL